MTTRLHWWYVHAAQTPHAWTRNEEGSLAEKVTWEIESFGNRVTFWPLLKVGESVLQIITCRQEHECSEKQKVTIQFHRAVGAGVEGQTVRRENGRRWWENSICGAATQACSLRLMMEDWEAVQTHKTLPEPTKLQGKILKHYYICKMCST